MARRRKGLNRHQKAAFRGGEHRVRGEAVQHLIEMAYSEDAGERLLAAENLCPCHVRKRVEAAWEALYRLMQDADVRVRRAAWHTLEDGGCPNDPALLSIFELAVANETDSQVRRWVERFAAPALSERSRQDALRAAYTPFQAYGRCDFCGGKGLRVRTDYETELNGSGGSTRPARICQQCDGGASKLCFSTPTTATAVLSFLPLPRAFQLYPTLHR